MLFTLPIMKKSKLLFLALFILVNFSCLFAQTTVKVKVVGITDGDTITVLDNNNRQIKIRLAGIDAPESRQDYGYAAKQKLSELIFGRKVTVIIYKEDRYGRSIAKILLNGRDINLAMVEAGMAWHYKEYENEQEIADRKLYADAEIKAREGKIALWSLPNPFKPSEFRRAEKTRSENPAPKPPQTSPPENRIILPVPPTSGVSNGSTTDTGTNENGKEKTVNVKGYTRKDGTVVAPYKRSKPNQ